MPKGRGFRSVNYDDLLSGQGAADPLGFSVCGKCPPLLNGMTLRKDGGIYWIVVK